MPKSNLSVDNQAFEISSISAQSNFGKPSSAVTNKLSPQRDVSLYGDRRFERGVESRDRSSKVAFD